MDKSMNYVETPEIVAEQRSFMSKVYGWMSLALLTTAVIAYFVASSPILVKTITQNRLLFFGLIIGELFLVVRLARKIKTMSASQATGSFFIYAALNGLTLSVIFLV